MITLYTNGCSICNVVKRMLNAKGIAFDEVKVACDPPAHLREHGIRSMPIIEIDDLLFEGHDCIEAIEEGEVI